MCGILVPGPPRLRPVRIAHTACAMFDTKLNFSPFIHFFSALLLVQAYYVQTVTNISHVLPQLPIFIHSNGVLMTLILSKAPSCCLDETLRLVAHGSELIEQEGLLCCQLRISVHFSFLFFLDFAKYSHHPFPFHLLPSNPIPSSRSGFAFWLTTMY